MRTFRASCGVDDTIATLATLAILANLVACGGSDGPTTPPNPSTKTVNVVFAGGTVAAEIAALRAEREAGLMNRASIAADSGMLFVWAVDLNPVFAPFYMRNTHFDLSVAFLDAQKRVINIEDMVHDTETNHFATAPFRYALEARRGWFASHGVAAGSVATFTLPAGVIIDP